MARDVFKEQPVHLELNPVSSFLIPFSNLIFRFLAGRCVWRYSWTIHWPIANLQQTWISAVHELPVFRRFAFFLTFNLINNFADYVDRGSLSLETISLLFCYKVAYPKNFFLLRGNHECEGTNKSKHDSVKRQFQDECRRRYPSKWEYVWARFNEAFAQMPLTAIIGDRILLMHGYWI